MKNLKSLLIITITLVLIICTATPVSAIATKQFTKVEENATKERPVTTTKSSDDEQTTWNLVTVGGKTFHNYTGGYLPGGYDHEVGYDISYMNKKIKENGNTKSAYYAQDMNTFCDLQTGVYTAKSISRMMKAGFLLEFIDRIRKESFNGTPIYPYKITANWTTTKPVGTTYWVNGVYRKVVAQDQLYMSVCVPKECYKSVTVSTQKELDAAIKKISVKKLWTVTIKTNKAVNFVIPNKTVRYYGNGTDSDGYYRSKLQTTTFVLNAPNATVTNNGNIRAVRGKTKVKQYTDNSPDVDIYETWRPAKYNVYE